MECMSLVYRCCGDAKGARRHSRKHERPELAMPFVTTKLQQPACMLEPGFELIPRHNVRLFPLSSGKHMQKEYRDTERCGEGAGGAVTVTDATLIQEAAGAAEATGIQHG